MASDNSIFKPFLIYILVVFIAFVLCVLYFSQLSGDKYKSNEFLVSLNNQKLNYIYREKYNNKVAKESYDLSNDYKDTVIIHSEKMWLDFKEYEIYDINNLKVNSGFNNNVNSEHYTYKLVNNKVKIKIKKDNKILYNGNYIPDISNYTKEIGRYYLHIYIDRIENSNKVNTDLSMTFIIKNIED